VITDIGAGSRDIASGAMGVPAVKQRREGLSVVIANWHHRDYAPRAIRSALDAVAVAGEAGYPGEVLVIDDASRDGSARLFRTVISNQRAGSLRLIELPRNRGLPHVRNLGLKLARFRYVCMLDADNELLAANIGLFLKAISATDATLVYGNLIDREGEEVVGLRSNDTATLRLTANNYIDAMALIHADRLTRLGGYTTDDRLHGWEDWELVLHLIAEEEPIVFVPAVYGYYFINHLSMIQETNQRAQERRALLQRMYWQGGPRDWDKIRVGRTYHPEIGYLGDWR
jgi:glycosyltransferase involved in cell wall biosynthesis